MNKWQEKYCNEYYNGKIPRSKKGKEDYEFLGKIKSKVTVEFPEFNGANGIIPAHTDTYIVTENDCNIPEGKISVTILIGNLKLWMSRGYKITTN